MGAATNNAHNSQQPVQSSTVHKSGIIGGNEINPGQNFNPSGKDDHNIFNHKDGGVMDQNYGGQLQQQKHPFLKPGGYDYINGEQLPSFGGGYLQNSPSNPYGMQKIYTYIK